MADAPADLKRHLQTLKALRGDPAVTPARLKELKAWQARRLAATYADLSAEPRYAAATAFFLEDLYGPKDFSSRDEAMMRILPAMTRMLPASAVETAAFAIELEALSEDLDHRLAAALPAGPIDAQSYAEAYRASARPAERARQIDLLVAVGRRLDALVRKPFVLGTLKLMRRPARLAGLADLQDFLERGFEAFSRMQGSDTFLALIAEREAAIASALWAGKPWPSPAPAS